MREMFMFFICFLCFMEQVVMKLSMLRAGKTHIVMLIYINRDYDVNSLVCFIIQIILIFFGLTVEKYDLYGRETDIQENTIDHTLFDYKKTSDRRPKQV